MSLVGHTPVTVCGVSGRAGSAERDRDRARASAQQQRRHDGASQQQQRHQRGSQRQVLPIAADRGREGEGGADDRAGRGRRGTARNVTTRSFASSRSKRWAPIRMNEKEGAKATVAASSAPGSPSAA